MRLRLADVTPITTSLEVGEPFAVTWPASDDIVSVTVLRCGPAARRNKRQHKGESLQLENSLDPQVLLTTSRL